MSEEKLLLWDIDGTLLHAGFDGHHAFWQALEDVIGENAKAPDMRFDGRTDLSIARILLVENGIPDDQIDRKMVLVCRAVAKRMAEHRDEISSMGKVLPGVNDLLLDLKASDVINTVVTGNVTQNAVLKMSTFGLDTAIDMEVGAFGNEREIRAELVDLVLKRVEKKYGATFEPENIWIIGDTVHDYNAARENGIKVALVASGFSDHEELAALEPDVLFDDLSDPAAFKASLEISNIRRS